MRGRPSHSIKRSNLDGSEVETVLQLGSGNFNFPNGLALDKDQNHLYFAWPWGEGIYRTNLDGTNMVRVIERLTGPIDIKLDLTGGKIYWTENAIGSVLRANLDGTGVEVLVSGLGNPLGLDLDLAAGKIYWADQDYLKIQRANLDGSQVEDVISAPDLSPLFIALDIPEPGMVILLLIGGPLCLRRRRACP